MKITYTDVFTFMIENNYEKHNYNDTLSKKLNSFQVKMGKPTRSNILF